MELSYSSRNGRTRIRSLKKVIHYRLLYGRWWGISLSSLNEGNTTSFYFNYNIILWSIAKPLLMSDGFPSL